MSTVLKILILEDSPDDAEMVSRLLKKMGLDFEFCIAMTREEYIWCLDDYKPDVILSDNSLPQFNATEALKLLRERSLYIPFILVTGTVSEEFAAEIIKQGADDYILKDRLVRLPSAIINALRQRNAEKEKLEAVEKLKISEENLTAIFQNTSEAFVLTDRACIIKAFNENAQKFVMMSTKQQLYTGVDIYRFLSVDRVEEVKDTMSKVLAGQTVEYERLYMQEGSSSLWFHFSMRPVWKNGIIDGTCITATDITEQKRSENTRQAMEREIFRQRVQAQKELARAVMKGQETERNRIGQELHDNVNQILAGTKMFLSSAGKNDERLQSLIKYPMELLDKCMDEIRQLSHKQVTPLKDINLRDLVVTLLRDLEKNTSIKTNFTYELGGKMDDDMNLNIYRIIQEQVSNISKHAGAGHVNIVIEGRGNQVKILVEDDGKGFDVNQQRRGVGISNMINRIELFNGEVSIESAPGKGTRVLISIPY